MTPTTRSRRQSPAGSGGPGSGPSGRGPGGPAGRRPAPTGARPRLPASETPEALAADFARLYLEVECGRRPARQLARLMDPVLHARLEAIWVRPGPPGRVLALCAQRSETGRVDAVVVVRRGERSGALALTLSRRGGRWLVTTAVRPEDGPLPPAPFSAPPDDLDNFDLVVGGPAVEGRAA